MFTGKAENISRTTFVHILCSLGSTNVYF